MYTSVRIENFKIKKNISLFLGEYCPFNISDSDIARYKKRNNDRIIELSKYIKVGTTILDADLIQKHLFPRIKNDIFLSHAHGDEDEVIKLAIILEKKGLKVFVDSCVWANAFTLLKTIDKKYCYNEDTENYNYYKRNFSTANIFIILNAALQRMIDNTELFIFLDTENSTQELKINELIHEEKGLSSPWIFSELSFAQQVRRKDNRKDLKEMRFLKKIAEDMRPTMESAELKITYPLPKTDFTLNNFDFNVWLKYEKIPLEIINYTGCYKENEKQLEYFYNHLFQFGSIFNKKFNLESIM